MSDRSCRLNIPYPPMPKKRPRFDSRSKRAYMPKKYMEWKENVAEVAKLTAGVSGLSGPLSLIVEFHKEHMVIVISEGASERFGQADIDNLLGGVMDALQDSEVIHNDRQISRVLAAFNTEGK